MSTSNLVTTTAAAELYLALNPLTTQATGQRYSAVSPNPGWQGGPYSKYQGQLFPQVVTSPRLSQAQRLDPFMLQREYLGYENYIIYF